MMISLKKMVSIVYKKTARWFLTKVLVIAARLASMFIEKKRIINYMHMGVLHGERYCQ